jgi:hypothetical protein
VLERVHLYTGRQVHRVLQIRRVKGAARRQVLRLPAWSVKEAKQQKGGALMQHWGSRRHGTAGKCSRRKASGDRTEQREQPAPAAFGCKTLRPTALGRGPHSGGWRGRAA